MRIKQATNTKKPKLKKEKNTFVYKERKERVFKPNKKLPDEFYTSTRTGYAWCETCEGYRVNVLNGIKLTCAGGHSITLPKSGVAQTLKLEKQVNLLIMI